jgi:glycerol-3-phosphate acyltransferase PlsY
VTVPQIAEIVLCIAFAAAGYLLGLIPFGRWLKGPAGLLLDVAKIVAACLIGWGVTQYLIQNHVPLGFRVDLWNTHFTVGFVAGMFALIGHFFPVWLAFRKRKPDGH